MRKTKNFPKKTDLKTNHFKGLFMMKKNKTTNKKKIFKKLLNLLDGILCFLVFIIPFLPIVIEEWK